MQPRITADFFQRDAITVARSLLGQSLVRLIKGQRLAGTIVETEAYLGEKDLAAHTVGGRHTQRNHSMWLAGGHAYVYFTYGMHYCLNVVAGKEDQPVAVLIRALEPTEGLDEMRHQRKKAKVTRDLCSGPAKLCQALQIDRKLDGENLVTSDAMFIEKLRSRAYGDCRITATTRVGVHYAGDWAKKPLRFYLKDCEFISRK